MAFGNGFEGLLPTGSASVFPRALGLEFYGLSDSIGPASNAKENGLLWGPIDYDIFDLDVVAKVPRDVFDGRWGPSASDHGPLGLALGMVRPGGGQEFEACGAPGRTAILPIRPGVPAHRGKGGLRSEAGRTAPSVHRKNGEDVGGHTEDNFYDPYRVPGIAEGLMGWGRMQVYCFLGP